MKTDTSFFGAPRLDHRVKKDHKNLSLKQQMSLKPAVSSPAAIKQGSSYNPTLCENLVAKESEDCSMARPSIAFSPLPPSRRSTWRNGRSAKS